MIVSRFVHYSAVLFLFGALLFPLYARTSLANIVKRRAVGASFVALISGVAWFVFALAQMMDSFGDAMSFGMLSTMGMETVFGRLWTVRMGVLLLLTLALFANIEKRRIGQFVALTLAAAALASLAGTGHTQAQDGGAFLAHAAADALHLLAAGAWLGGLVPLVALLTWRGSAYARSDADIGRVLMRFSGMGYVTVAVLIATGIVNGLYLIDDPFQLPASTYGRLLLVKLGLFGGMLVLAALNRFWFVPAFKRSNGGLESETSIARLRNHVITEQILGLGVIAIVSVIGTLSPNPVPMPDGRKLALYSQRAFRSEAARVRCAVKEGGSTSSPRFSRVVHSYTNCKQLCSSSLE